jgi:hypothetical protein
MSTDHHHASNPLRNPWDRTEQRGSNVMVIFLVLFGKFCGEDVIKIKIDYFNKIDKKFK